MESAAAITPEFHSRLKKSRLLAGDILFVRVGANRGDCCTVPEGLGELNCANIVFARPKDDGRFFAFFFRSPVGRNLLLSASTGAAQGVINTGSVAGMPVPVPPLAEQQRVAALLGAYDDLIENIQRRVQVLEMMARALHREWFVEFRYPDTANAAASSDLPAGWARARLPSVAAVNRAQLTPRTAPEQIQYIDIASVSPGRIGSATTYAFADAPGRARRIVQHGDVIWSCVRPNRRSYALVMNPEPDTIVSTGFAVLTAESVPFSYLYLATTTDAFVDYLTNHATGAAYPAVTAATFERAEIVLPPAALLQRFDSIVRPMLEQVAVLQRQIKNLRATRDLLLPRLLSGQLPVTA